MLPMVLMCTAFIVPIVFVTVTVASAATVPRRLKVGCGKEP